MSLMMKKLLLTIPWALFICKVYAYDTIYVASRFSVHLLFEDPIAKAECLPAVSLVDGTDDLTQMELDVDGNKMALYANLEGFPTSNLYVETDGGHVFIFILAYRDAPEKLFHSFDNTDAVHSPTPGTIQKDDLSSSERFLNESGESVNTDEQNTLRPLENSEIADIAAKVLQEKTAMLTGVQKQRMMFVLGNPFIDNGLTYLPVLLENDSDIPYTVRGDIIFIATEKDRRKRQTVTPVEYRPVYIHGKDKKAVSKDAPLRLVYVFESFTLQEGKRMDVHLIEEEGGRDLTLSFDNKGLLRARTW
jgi:hypothetical protein